MYVEMTHVGIHGITKAKITEFLAKKYKAKPECIFVYGMRFQFGGGRSSAFAHVYDSIEAVKKTVPWHLLIRKGMAEQHITIGKKARAEQKNKKKRTTGKERYNVPKRPTKRYRFKGI